MAACPHAARCPNACTCMVFLTHRRPLLPRVTDNVIVLVLRYTVSVSTQSVFKVVEAVQLHRDDCFSNPNTSAVGIVVRCAAVQSRRVLLRQTSGFSVPFWPDAPAISLVASLAHPPVHLAAWLHEIAPLVAAVQRLTRGLLLACRVALMDVRACASYPMWAESVWARLGCRGQQSQHRTRPQLRHRSHLGTKYRRSSHPTAPSAVAAVHAGLPAHAGLDSLSTSFRQGSPRACVELHR
mmetsp:Transcript_13697/g.35225  ORF Transcript_13697/g.35225 Transcript_13697/m.35225 type:complete len:239 (-) Transcript_13697:470-1186(-)